MDPYSKIHALENELNSSKKTIVELEKSIFEALKNPFEFIQEIEELKTNNTLLQNDISELSRFKKQVLTAEKLNQEISEKRMKLAQMDVPYYQKKDELALLNQQIQFKQNELQEIMLAIELQDSKLSQAKLALEDTKIIQSQLKDENEQMILSIHEYEQIIADLNAQLKQLELDFLKSPTKSIEDLSVSSEANYRIDDKTETIKKLKQDLVYMQEEYENELFAQEEQNDRLLAQISKLESALAEKETLDSIKSRSQELIIKYEQSLTEKNDLVSQLMKKIQLLEQELIETSRDLKSSQEMDSKLQSKYDSMLMTKNEEIKELSLRIVQLEEKIHQLSTSYRSNFNLEELKCFYEQSIMEKDLQIEELKLKLDHMVQTPTLRNSSFSQKSIGSFRLSNKDFDLENQKIEEMNLIIKELELEKKELSELISFYQNNEMKLKTLLNEKHADLSRGIELIQKLEHEASSHQESISAIETKYHNRIQEFTAELNASKEKITGLENYIESLVINYSKRNQNLEVESGNGSQISQTESLLPTSSESLDNKPKRRKSLIEKIGRSFSNGESMKSNELPSEPQSEAKPKRRNSILKKLRDSASVTLEEKTESDITSSSHSNSASAFINTDSDQTRLAAKNDIQNDTHVAKSLEEIHVAFEMDVDKKMEEIRKRISSLVERDSQSRPLGDGFALDDERINRIRSPTVVSIDESDSSSITSSSINKKKKKTLKSFLRIGKK